MMLSTSPTSLRLPDLADEPSPYNPEERLRFWTESLERLVPLYQRVGAIDQHTGRFPHGQVDQKHLDEERRAIAQALRPLGWELEALECSCSGVTHIQVKRVELESNASLVP